MDLYCAFVKEIGVKFPAKSLSCRSFTVCGDISDSVIKILLLLVGIPEKKIDVGVEFLKKIFI
ncbi:hypothetical protein HSX44_00445 [Wolbachia endosymbiont of Onchocerca gibsoni]|uniref:hypothetical protein n=1 Tax=Wolbachia endosymbiont of Onchocerca gibsoni TaxID=118986 RepID=UPI0023D815C4|nr:hypothetical protein [Wolbachia endosymbiont of Onchocerca gibsoni]MDF0607382.1 hypothetical protein [Wolbachia endosymbiont of Onchocerca gibsoni]